MKLQHIVKNLVLLKSVNTPNVIGPYKNNLRIKEGMIPVNSKALAEGIVDFNTIIRHLLFYCPCESELENQTIKKPCN